MEATNNALPRKLTDTTEATCATCGAIMFSKTIVSVLQDDDTYVNTSYISGNYSQEVDEDGQPTGPMIPKCSCKEDNNA